MKQNNNFIKYLFQIYFIRYLFYYIRYLFWTDWGVGNSRVERSTLAGDDRVQIWKADGDGDGWPNGLTIDYMENRVYWADAKYVDILLLF